jgi:hypothetical protein
MTMRVTEDRPNGPARLNTDVGPRHFDGSLRPTNLFHSLAVNRTRGLSIVASRWFQSRNAR